CGCSRACSPPPATRPSPWATSGRRSSRPCAVPASPAAPSPTTSWLELSSYQLHWSGSLAPKAAAVLNIAPDHLDWHGTMDAYVDAKAKIFAPGCVAVYNADDDASAALAERAPGLAGRAGFTLGTPRPGEFGVVEDLLVDRAFTG